MCSISKSSAPPSFRWDSGVQCLPNKRRELDKGNRTHQFQAKPMKSTVCSANLRHWLYATQFKEVKFGKKPSPTLVPISYQPSMVKSWPRAVSALGSPITSPIKACLAHQTVLRESGPRAHAYQSITHVSHSHVALHTVHYNLALINLWGRSVEKCLLDISAW